MQGKTKSKAKAKIQVPVTVQIQKPVAPQIVQIPVQQVPKQVSKPVQKPITQIPVQQVPKPNPKQMKLPVQQVPKKKAVNHHKQQAASLRLLNDTEQNKQKTTVAVIVTFSHSSCYDPLFTTQQQKSLQGTKVQVYVCDSFYIDSLIEAILNNNPKDQTAKLLIQSIKKVQPDCVVFNWECCQNYGGQKFPEGTDKVFYFLKKAIDRGHMCMFSDFSLKALIHEWHQKYQLGPNPFVKTGQFAGTFEVRFSSSVLKQCPSAQLQIVGDMAQQGRCNIHALGSTIQYCVDSDKIKHEVYKTEVLTIVSNIKPPKENLVSKIGVNEGCAGHVLLRYPSGGVILTSMGHWIELMKIDTSEKKLFQIAEQEFGVVQASKMKAQYNNLDKQSQMKYVSSKAKQFVQSQAPCANMNRKKKM